MSCTCQTTTAAISIGLPSASLTLACAVSRFLILVETGIRLENGFTHCMPGSRIVPVYLPKSCTTCARPGATMMMPRSTVPVTMARTMPTTVRTASVAPLCAALCQNATTVAASRTRSIRSTIGPGMYQAERSRIGWLGE